MDRSTFCGTLREAAQGYRAWIVGITGEIGVGKTTVATILQRSYPVLSADTIAKQLYESPAVHAMLRQHCPELFDGDKMLPPTVRARLLFARPTLRKRVQALLYPFVFDQLWEQTRYYLERGNRIVIHESALLLEERIAICYSCLIVVDAPLEKRRRWIAPSLRATWEQRRSAQLPAHYKHRFARYVINNSHSLEQLYCQAERCLDWLQWQERRLRGG